MIKTILSRSISPRLPIGGALTCRRRLTQGDIKAQRLLDELYTAVRAQRFNDIVVIKTKFNADPRYLILASAFNARHLVNGTELVNKQFKNSIKTADENFAALSVADEWNVIDFSSVVVHLFSRTCRERFDIEQLWAVGEEYDDLINNKDILDGSL